MPQVQDPEQVNAALRAVFLLIGDPGLQSDLRDERLSGQALARLGLPASTRTGLLDIVNKLVTRLDERRDPGVDAGSDSSSQRKVERILLESFVHIRWSFWVSILMSVILFLVGLVFLGTALAQSLSATNVSTSTLTVAGLGIADFVLLFYARPWKDVTTNLANSQQIRMIATSYLASFPLIRDGDPHHLKALEELTERSVRLVQNFVEEGPATAKPGSAPSADATTS